MDWLDLLDVQGTLKSLLQHHSSKASILWCLAISMVQLSHPYMTTAYARSLPNAVSYGVTVPDRVRLFGFEKGGAHQADEYGDIPNLMRSIRVFIHTLIEIDDLVAEL